MPHIAQTINCANTITILSAAATTANTVATAANTRPRQLRRSTRGPANVAAAAALVLLIGLASAGQIIDDGDERQYLENFNDLPIGSVPDDTWYDVTQSGTGTSLVNTAPAGLSPGNAWQIQDTATPYVVQMTNTGVGVNICDGDQAVSFEGNLPDLALNNIWEYRVTSGAISTSGAPLNSMGIRFTGLFGSINNVNFFVRGSTGEVRLSATGTIGAGVFSLLISQVNCPGTGSALFTVTGVTGLSTAVVTAAPADPFTGTFTDVSIANTAGAVGTTVWFDDYFWTGTPLPAPTITNISPESGSTEGGTSVTITGTGFVDPPTVEFDGIPATAIVYVGATEITATTPSHAQGIVDVTVTNPDTQTATLTGGYTYVDPIPGSGAFDIETFEDDAVGNAPVGPGYTFTRVTTPSDVVVCPYPGTSGTHCFRGGAVGSANQGGRFDYGPTAICDNEVGFQWSGFGGPSVGGEVLIGTASSTPINLIWSQTGINEQTSYGSVQFGSTGWTGGSLAAVTALHFVFTCQEPTPGILLLRLTESSTGTSYSRNHAYTYPTFPQPVFTRWITNGGPYIYDDIGPAGGGIPPDVVIDVVDLTGFEVDPTNSVAIARVDDGETIKTYNPTDLSELASQGLDGGCGGGHWDGVGAIKAENDLYTTYYNCEPGGETDRLAVRNHVLQAPTQPQICIDGGFCDIDLDGDSALTNGACNSLSLDDQELPVDMTRLGKVSMALWDWSTNSEEGADHATLGWVYTGSVSGNVGLFGITQNNNAADCAGIVERQATTDTDVPSQACYAHNSETGKMAIVTSDDSGPSRSFAGNVIVTQAFGGASTNWYPDVRLDTGPVSAGTYANQIALSCAEEQWGIMVGGEPQIDTNGIAGLVMDTSGMVRHTNVYPTQGKTAWGTATWQQQGYANGEDHDNAVAISGDGRWGMYQATATTANVVNATSGELRAILGLPSGTCCWEMKLDDTGQTAYVAARTYIAKWDIAQYTTVTPVPPLTRPVYDGTGNGTYNESVCVNTNGITDPECTNASNPECTQTPGGCATTGGQPAPPTQGEVPGSLAGCGIGFSIFGLSAVLQMAILTAITMVVFVVGAYILTMERGGISGAIIAVLAVLAYVLSLFLWCAPVWPLIVLSVLGVVFAFVKSRSGTGA